MLIIPLIIQWRQYLSTVAGECVIMFLTAWSRAQTGRHRPATPGNMGRSWRMKSRKKPMFWILKPARWTCCVWTSTSLLRAALEHWVLKMSIEHCEHCSRFKHSTLKHWVLKMFGEHYELVCCNVFRSWCLARMLWETINVNYYGRSRL